MNKHGVTSHVPLFYVVAITFHRNESSEKHNPIKEIPSKKIVTQIKSSTFPFYHFFFYQNCNNSRQLQFLCYWGHRTLFVNLNDVSRTNTI